MVLLGATVVAACNNPNLILTVNSFTYTHQYADADAGDGICEVDPGGHNCTLPAAVDEANANPRVTQIVVPAGTWDLNDGVEEDDNHSGDLDLHPASGVLIIDGAGVSAGATILSDAPDGVFDVQSGLVLIGGVDVRPGSWGTGVHVHAGADVGILGTRIHDGGVGVAVDAGGQAQLRNTVVTRESAATVDNAGSFRSELSTLDGPLRNRGTASTTGSIFRGSTAAAACSSPIVSDGYNLAGDGSCSLTDPTDVLATDVRVEPESSVPYTGSPALDSIPAGTPTLCDGTPLYDVDERGGARPVNDACDRGAIESSVRGAAFTVTSPLDVHDASPGDGVCATASGSCTLRAAADEVDAEPPGVFTIRLAADPVLSIAGGSENANATGDIDLSQPTTIDGGGHAIDAAQVDRVLDATAPLVLDHVTITGGVSPNVANLEDGGGVRGTTIAVRDSTIAGNRTGSPTASGGGVVGGTMTFLRSTVRDNVGGFGGGIEGGDLVVDHSAIVDNRATNVGGGFAVLSGTVGGNHLVDSTVNGNAAPGFAGALVGNMSVIRSTITDNVGDSSLGIGGIVFQGSISRSIITGPGTACATGSIINFSAGNVANDASCGASTVVADPLLGPLALNGATTPNRLPAVGSPAIDLLAPCRGTDQRGAPRSVGSRCDAGAVERQPTDP